LSNNFNAFVNAGYSANEAFAATIRSYNAGLAGTLSSLSTPGLGMVSLDAGTNPPNENYVSGVLNIWANCFGGSAFDNLIWPTFDTFIWPTPGHKFLTAPL